MSFYLLVPIPAIGILLMFWKLSKRRFYGLVNRIGLWVVTLYYIFMIVLLVGPGGKRLEELLVAGQYEYNMLATILLSVALLIIPVGSIYYVKYQLKMRSVDRKDSSTK